ncbi:hypothetical protein [Pseudoduganella ginsengisoli]|uniref:Uncharacterized protein n=1 Tax=Pseudoduganella ginsengisoli TaxID=1462440 RepID=A0A6L6Q2M8_9BURK|nr:hypothetical protein [Pseudoduganella ginsengisoli]
MKHVTLEQFTDILEVMTITQSVESGFAITHFGYVDGRRTVAISTCYGNGECYILQ